MNVGVNEWSEEVERAIVGENRNFLDEKFRGSPNFHNARSNLGDSLLHYAVEKSNERMVRYFLAKGVPSDCTSILGQTPLHLAVIHCKFDVVKLLLNHGSPIDARDLSTRTALHHALLKRSRYSRSIVNYLLQRGADVNASTHPQIPRWAETPLFQAIAYRCESLVRLCLTHGADVNQRAGENGHNALHYAVQKGHTRIVEMILEAGVEVNSVMQGGKTALHLAAASANEEIFKLLIDHGADVNVIHNGKTPLFRAIADGSEGPIRLFLKYGANVNQSAGEKGLYPLHYGVQKGHTRIVEILLNAGAEVNNAMQEGKTALHLAAASAGEKIVELLIERGAMVNAADNDGKTPIFMAVRILNNGDSQMGSRCSTICGIMRILLDAGAEINHLSNAGETVLHQALTRCPAPLIIKILLERGADVHIRNSQGQSVMHIAIEYGYEDAEKVIKLLIARGAYINAADADGYTPMHYVARLQTSQPVAENLKILLDNGANLFAKSKDGTTPLEYAIANSNEKMSRDFLRYLALLEAKGDPRATGMAMREIGKVNDGPRWLQIYKAHQCEMASIKKEIIYKNVSLFNVITSDLDTLVRNEEFVTAFQTNQTIKKYHFYRRLSRDMYQALSKKELSEEAIEYLAVLLRVANFPIVILERILKNFELDELKVFVKSCRQDDELRRVLY